MDLWINLFLNSPEALMGLMRLLMILHIVSGNVVVVFPWAMTPSLVLNGLDADSVSDRATLGKLAWTG
jgi:hypothetical protein